MIHLPTVALRGLLVWFVVGCVSVTTAQWANAQSIDSTAEAATPAVRRPLQDHYHKQEHRITMRDGIELHVAVFSPKDTSQTYPILLRRTPYSCQPYHTDRLPASIGPSAYMEDEGYIFVHQDVRGRWMSDGDYDNMRPHRPDRNGIDESSDTYDTIEWLLENVPNHNGRVGLWGISYPGFYAAAALPDAHPAIAAVSPQAPIADFYFDDFHHHGAFFLSYFIAVATFGYQHDGPTDRVWYQSIRPGTPDGYQFYMDLGALSNADRFYGEDNFFWQQLVEHPNYDEFWQARSILPHLRDTKPAVMTVGGWFDAEDLYGPLNIYRTIEKHTPDAFNVLVMGPWAHGAWARRERGPSMTGNLFFGTDLADQYQRDVEAPFFRHFLKLEGQPPEFEALVFDTGKRTWSTYQQWPPQQSTERELFLHPQQRLDWQPPSGTEPPYIEFVSDPAKPVPHSEDIKLNFTPRKYMTDDQRFAGRRPDVLVFQTEVLEDEVTLVGDLLAHLFVSTDQTDADWIVKLIDVFPPDKPNHETTPAHIRLGGYQMMVRSEVIRGRFRNSYQHPEPFEPDQVAEVRVPLQDVYHTFKPGHRIMVQVQSTWFPLVDRNPQKYVPNIFKAKDEDFTAATHRVYVNPDHSTRLKVRVLSK